MNTFGKILLFTALLCYANKLTLAKATEKSYCTPNTDCWPTLEQWESLEGRLTGQLHSLATVNYNAVCKAHGDNSFGISASGNGSCMQYHDCSKEFCDGKSDVWNIPSYSVEAKTVEDIQEAIKFANTHNLEVTVKTSGHSYSGSSMGKNSLLIWMYNFIKYTEIKENFTDSCGNLYPHTIKVGGGETWNDVYFKLRSDFHIVGGGGLTVSAAGGWLQGCGLSAMSRKYGIGIDNVLNFEVVLANGTFMMADACSNPDLFWALRGGGGGTWGVVTSIHYRIYPAETVTFFFMDIKIVNRSVDTVDAWIEKWVELSPNLDRRWGGYWTLNTAIMYFVGNKSEAERTFINEIQAFKDALPEKEKALVVLKVEETPSYFDSRSGDNMTTDPTGEDNFNIASRLIPRDWVTQNKQEAKDLLKWLVRNGFYTFNYILGGRVTEVGRNATAVHPAMRKAIWQINTFSDEMAQKVRDVVNDTGAGYNHASKKEPDWKNAFWGTNLDRLVMLKKQYDPDHRFNCWHCVGYQSYEPPKSSSGNHLSTSSKIPVMMTLLSFVFLRSAFISTLII